MIVLEVFGQQPSCVPLVEDEHVIHQISATAPDPALRDPVLPGTAERRAHGLYKHVLDRRDHLAIKRRVPIQEEIPGRRAVGKRLPQLLTDTRRGKRELVEQTSRCSTTTLLGAPRIHCGLLKLGVTVSERTVSRYLQDQPRDHGSRPSWLAFLRGLF